MFQIIQVEFFQFSRQFCVIQSTAYFEVQLQAAGVEIGGKLYIPHAGGRKPAVLLVADKMSSYWIPSTAAVAERIAKTGRVVLELEPRDSPGEAIRGELVDQRPGQPDRP